MDYFTEGMTFDFSIDGGDLLCWLKARIDRDRETLNNQPVITDAGTDITQSVAGRLQAYIGVKDYIERGIAGQKK